MAKYLLFLLLILTSLRSNDALAQSCYCTTPYYNNGTGAFQNYCIANTDCWACAPGAYSTAWQQAFCSGYTPPPPACTTITETRLVSCPVNYSGSITESRTKTCPDNQWQAWQTNQNSCVANPPTCKTTTEQQTLSCQTGFTGSITQTRSSMCPNPYGQPIMGAWTTTTDTCIKSISNPTNPTSPVAQSIISPTVTAPTTSLLQTTPLPTTPQSAPPMETPAEAPKQETSSTNSQPTSQATSNSTTSTSQPTSIQSPKPKLSIGGLNLVSSLELVSKPLVQYNSLPVQTISQEMPLEVRLYNNMMMDMIGIKPINQDEQFNLLGKDAMEFEQ